MGSPGRLRNPLALSAVALTEVGLGMAYLVTYLDLVPYEYVLLPYHPLPSYLITATVWIVSGIFLALSLFKWSWFRLAVSVSVAVYGTWAILYLVGFIMVPDPATMISILLYLSMVPILITLGAAEVDETVCDRTTEDHV